MNWLDLILITINILLILFGIATIILAILEHIKNWWTDWSVTTICFWVGYVLFGWMIILLPFLVLDKASGTTIGTITSVDNNFFGTTAVYIKTTETNEEKYCIEFDEELEEQAKHLIGKKVKISYGKRVGWYSTGKCHQAPIETIDLIGE